MMIVRGVNVFPSQIEELILKQAELAPHYQCVLGKDGHMDTLTVRVECIHGSEPARAQAARERLAHEIKSYIGVTATIEVLQEGGIERSVGKAKRIVDQRPR
ncbi:Phenylacetate-coenzyme A ligase [compost metagenome]